MNSVPLTLWGQGAVTLPKAWRDQFDTKHFMAVVTPDGLLIKPIVFTEYYEKSPTHVGVRFPMGIGVGELYERVKKINAKLNREERATKRRRAHGSR